MYIHSQQQPRFPTQQIYSPYVFECINCIIQPSEERGGLYLGDLLATMRTDTLVNFNIGAVLSVAIDGKYNKTSDPRTLHIATKHILAHDIYGYDISQHFEECIEWIEHYLSQKVNVLVHCRAGKSRSASVVIAYMMKMFNMSYENAYFYVKNKRQRTEPNEGFKILLKQYESKLLAGSNSKPMRRSIIRNSEPLRSSMIAKQIVQQVKEAREQNPTSPASIDNNIQNKTLKSVIDFRKSGQNLRGSWNNRKNSQDNQDEKLMTPQKQSPRQRKISYEEKSPKLSNFENQRVIHEHKPIQQNLIYKGQNIYRPPTQHRYNHDQQNYQLLPQKVQQQPIQNIQPVYYHMPIQSPKPIYEHHQPIYQPPQQYVQRNYPIYHPYQQQQPHIQTPTKPVEQIQPKHSIQSIQQNIYQSPQASPQKPAVQKTQQKQASWLDWFSWLNHQ